MLKKQVGSTFLVVEFDAWRNSHVDPLWWSLLASLRRAAAEASGHPRRFRMREVVARLERAGQLSNAASGVVLAVAALAVFAVAVSPTKLAVSGVKNAAALGLAIALVGVPWRATVAANQF